MVKSVGGEVPSDGSMRMSWGVKRGLLAIGVLAHHDGEHLVGDGQRRVEPIARLQREAHVRHDEDVRVHRARHVDGEILRDAAVDQEPALILDRSEHAGRGDARTHRDG